MYGDAPIGENEVRDLVLGFFHSVQMGGPAAALEPMFADGAAVETWFGRAFSLDGYLALHAAFAEERHTILDLALMPLAGGRVRVVGEVEWEAVILATGAILQAVIGEDWVVERADDGRLRFARFVSTGIRYLPGSATLEV